MKTFDELLKENNVKLPKTSFRQNLFETKWSGARWAYAIYCKDYARKSQQWEKTRLEIQKKWDVLLPELSKIEPPVVFKFKNARKAERVISHARIMLENYSIWDLQSQKEKEFMKSWINELIAKADENTVLIVIKDKSHTPNDFNQTKFDKSVSEKEPCAIYLGFWPICMQLWVAFNPHEKNEDIQTWCMNKVTSEVTYIQK